MAYRRTLGVDTGDRADLQHLRPPDAPQRRARHPHVHPAGAGRRADHGRRRRLADPLHLLRRRPGRGHRSGCCGSDAGRAGQHRQPARDVGARELAELDPRPPGPAVEIVHIPRPEDDPTVRQPDITLARTALGWEPQVGLADGLRRTIAWFQRPEARYAVELDRNERRVRPRSRSTGRRSSSSAPARPASPRRTSSPGRRRRHGARGRRRGRRHQPHRRARRLALRHRRAPLLHQGARGRGAVARDPARRRLPAAAPHEPHLLPRQVLRLPAAAAERPAQPRRRSRPSAASAVLRRGRGSARRRTRRTSRAGSPPASAGGSTGTSSRPTPRRSGACRPRDPGRLGRAADQEPVAGERRASTRSCRRRGASKEITS